jgi:hypothetical protein
MIFTARQLQDLHAGSGANGELVLPYGARLTPLAADWARSKRLKIGFGPAEITSAGKSQPVLAAPLAEAKPRPAATLWWCDGPCGAAKAAIAAQARDSAMASITIANEPAQLTSAIKHLAQRVKGGSAGGGVLLVKSAAEAIVYANRCKSLRAIVGTCLESVDQGMNAIAANVLIVEYPHLSFPQIRNLLARFARGSRTPSEQTQRRLQEMAACA